MPGIRCKTCAHPDRAEIEMQLALTSLPVAEIARRHGLGGRGVHRHYRGDKAAGRPSHMPAHLIAETRAAMAPTEIDLAALEKSESESLLQNILMQRGYLWDSVRRCMDLDDTRGEIAAHGRILENLALSAKITGRINTHAQTTVNNLINHHEYIVLRGDMLEALRPHPAALKALMVVFEKREGAPPALDGSHTIPTIEHSEIAGAGDVLSP